VVSPCGDGFKIIKATPPDTKCRAVKNKNPLTKHKRYAKIKIKN